MIRAPIGQGVGAPASQDGLSQAEPEVSALRASIPNALSEQSCCISMSGNTVRIECDEFEDAEQLFDWLSELIGDPFDFNTEIEKEVTILEALTAAYNAGRIPYLHFSPAYDIGAARIDALLFAQGTPTRSAETTGSVGEADGGPVPERDAP